MVCLRKKAIAEAKAKNPKGKALKDEAAKKKKAKTKKAEKENCITLIILNLSLLTTDICQPFPISFDEISIP